MVYLVDGTAVNDRPDWRQALRPRPAMRQEIAFAGLSEVVVVRNPVPPPDVVMSGFFYGAAGDSAGPPAVSGVDAARGQVTYAIAWWTWAAQFGPYEVTVGTDVYPYCELLEVAVTGELTAGQTDAGTTAGLRMVKQPVRMVWRQLAW